MTVLFAFASEQEMVSSLPREPATYCRLHAMFSSDGNTAAHRSTVMPWLRWTVAAYPASHASLSQSFGILHSTPSARFTHLAPALPVEMIFERHAVFDGPADLVAHVSRIGSADDLVSGSDVESVAQTAELGRIAFASSLRASFEDEPLVDVAYLRVRARRAEAWICRAPAI